MHLPTLPSWISISTKAIAAAQRFPATLAVILALTVLVQIGKTELPWARWESWLLGLGCAVPLSVLPVLLAEARPRFPAILRLTLPWLAGIGGVALGVLEAPIVPTVLVLLAVNFALLAIPEAASPRGDGAAWLRGVTASVLLSGLAVQIVCIGVSILVWTIDALFDTHLAREVLERLWKLAGTLLLPGCSLALWPLGSATAPAPRWVRGMVDWLFAPLTLAFAAILHVYVFSRVFSGGLPKGVVGMTGAAFFALGGMAWTTAMMLDDEGAIRRLLRRAFLPLLIVPGIGMAIAAWTRIGTYGFTEERYLLLAMAALGILLPGFQFARRAVPRPGQVMTTLSVCCLLASFGPWGAYGFSLRSQSHRLTELLQRAAWSDPAASRGLRPASPDDAKGIDGAVRYLVERKREDLIVGAKLPPPSADRNFSGQRARDILAAWGMEPSAKSASPVPTFTGWQSAWLPMIPVAGYDNAFRIEIRGRKASSDAAISVGVPPGDVIVLTTPDKRDLRFDMASLASRLPPEKGEPASLDAMGSDAARARLIVTQIGWERPTPSDPLRLNNLTGYLLLKTP